MPDVAGDYLAFRALLLEDYRRALAQALPPRPRVARHWESADRLTFLALLSDLDAFHLAFSFGRLKGVPAPADGAPDTAGVFRLTGTTFPGVDAQRLSAALAALVPESVDGPSRAFLLRAAGQLATAEVAAALDVGRAMIPHPTSRDFVITLAARGDRLHEPAPPPRPPDHARDRVRAAAATVCRPLAARLEAVFAAPEPTLLEVVRRAAWTD